MSNESLEKIFLYKINNFLNDKSIEKKIGRSLCLDQTFRNYYDAMDGKTKRAVKKELGKYGWRLHNQEDVFLYLVPNN